MEEIWITPVGEPSLVSQQNCLKFYRQNKDNYVAFIMKQKKRKDKGRNAVIMKNKLAKSTSIAYKPIKSDTKDYRKNNYNTQIDNKEINRNIIMSMGLEGEDKNKSKTKTMDPKGEKPSLSKETVTTTTTTFSQLAPPESEVFDSSSDNAMSEMKEVADM